MARQLRVSPSKRLSAKFDLTESTVVPEFKEDSNAAGAYVPARLSPKLNFTPLLTSSPRMAGCLFNRNNNADAGGASSSKENDDVVNMDQNSNSQNPNPGKDSESLDKGGDGGSKEDELNYLELAQTAFAPVPPERFPFCTVKPPNVDYESDERFAKYLDRLLNENKSCPITAKVDGENMSFYVSAAVSLYLYSKEEARIDSMNRIIPVNLGKLNQAEKHILHLPHNADSKAVFARYPFLPKQHLLPVVKLNPAVYAKFHNFKKDIPVATKENCRVFMFAYSNIRYRSTTYAANCRHQTGQWDEHPFCALCWIKAGLPVCTNSAYPEFNGEICYICEVMGPLAIQCRESRFTYWRNRIKNEPDVIMQAKCCPNGITCQLVADFENPVPNDVNPDWHDGFFGFCRPSWIVPMFDSWSDFKLTLANKGDDVWNGKIMEHRADFRKWFEYLKPEEFDPFIWSPLGVAAMEINGIVDPPESLDVKSLLGRKSSNSNSDFSPETPLTRKRKAQQELAAKAAAEKAAAEKAAADKLAAEQAAAALRAGNDKSGGDASQFTLLQATNPNIQTITPLDSNLTIVQQQPLNLSLNPPAITGPANWTSDTDSVEYVWEDPFENYSYTAGLLAASRLSGVPVEKKRRMMSVNPGESLVTNPGATSVVNYTPTNRLAFHTNQVLEKYYPNYFTPHLPIYLPIGLSSFPESTIPSTAQAAHADSNGKLPKSNDTAVITEKELVSLDSVNLAQTKLCECDGFAYDAVWSHIVKMDESRPPEEKKKGHSDLFKAGDIVRRNMMAREELQGRSNAIVLATRRRNNALRMNLDEHSVAHQVSRKVTNSEYLLF